MLGACGSVERKVWDAKILVYFWITVRGSQGSRPQKLKHSCGAGAQKTVFPRGPWRQSTGAAQARSYLLESISNHCSTFLAVLYVVSFVLCVGFETSRIHLITKSSLLSRDHLLPLSHTVSGQTRRCASLFACAAFPCPCSWACSPLQHR